MKLPDGLYQVTTDMICAGFVVEDGKVKWCAPVLRKKLEVWWIFRAERVEYD